jgi:predicted PurR-regulated permease PerM
MSKFVHLFHILIVGSLFLYVGIAREKTKKFLYPVLLGLGIVVILYHFYKLMAHKNKKEKRYWISLIHILLVGPLMVFIGINKEKTSRKYYEMLLLLAFASVGYHGYYLVRGDV